MTTYSVMNEKEKLSSKFTHVEHLQAYHASNGALDQNSH